MASNRVERLQMRQRGAGTRKIKEVDFGFSLFGPPAGESSQPEPPASQPTNELDSAPLPEPPSLDAPAVPETTTAAPPQPQFIISPPRLDASFQNSAVQRTPGSARNKLPPRRSTFDIPAEDEPELARSSKRRKIESPKDLSPSIGAQAEAQNVEAVLQNSSIEESLAAPTEERRAIPIRTLATSPSQLPDQETAAEAPSIPTNDTIEPAPEAPDEAPSHLEVEVAERPASDPPQTNGTASPPSDTSSRKGKERKKRGRPSLSPKQASDQNQAEQAQAQSTEVPPVSEPVEAPQEQPQEQDLPESDAPRARDKRTRSRMPASEEQAEKSVDQAQTEDSAPEPVEAPAEGPEIESRTIREKRTRSRTPAPVQPENPPAGDEALIEETRSESAQSDATGKSRRGRKPKTLQATEETSEPTQKPDRPTEVLLEESMVVDDALVEDTRSESAPSDATGKGRRGRKPKTLQPVEEALETAQNFDEQPTVQPEKLPTADGATIEDARSESVPGEATSKGRRGRKPKTLQPTEEFPDATRESDEAATTQAEAQAAPEPITADEPSDTSQIQPNGVDKGQKRAGRPKKQAGPSPLSSEASVADTRKRQREESEARNRQAEESLEQEQAETDTSRAGKRRKHQKDREPTPRQEEEPQPEPEPEKQPRAGRKKQREPVPQDEQPEPEPEAPMSRAEKRKQRAQERRAEQEEPEPEPAVEQSRAGKGRKRRAEREPTLEQEPEAEAEQPRARKGKKRREEREPTPEQQPEPEVEQAGARKGKKRQEQVPDEQEVQEPEPEIEQDPPRPKGTKRKGRRPTIQPDETQETEEQPQPPKRKPRQPRGETVPVTVHRLANAGSLDGAPIESASEDEADTPDEIADRQPTKLPNRGGVNAADVLGQICRETLEKTLTTLKNGIANEVNNARRAEWTLRRKAVEAFGTELEGRLFDLSEMLDSNFMLGSKVKKAKRNMMEMRSRLDHVRREREAVALRMDAVRREHSREEDAGMARSTINHSLHNLDLAFERGRSQGQNQNRAEDESLTAGLELRLRNVARNVSSSAQGAQGGLLSQIKSFNARLEATAKRLEG